MQLPGEVGKKECDNDVCQVADSRCDEGYAEKLREQPRPVGKVAKGREPQAEEDLGSEDAVVLDLQQEQRERICSDLPERRHIGIRVATWSAVKVNTALTEMMPAATTTGSTIRRAACLPTCFNST